MALNHLSNGKVDAMCSRCIRFSPVIDSPEALVELGWELRSDDQTWCLQCGIDARTPKGRPNARGVVRRRRP
jgi:hypothetical protein